MHENREISCTPRSQDRGRSAKAINRTADMHVLEKSDCAVLPVNQPNKGGQPRTETGEGRAQTEENIIQSRMCPKKRMVAKLKAIKAELQRRKHHRTTEVGAWVRKVVLGYYQYHAVPGNSTQLRIFSRRVCWLWRSVLVRRSQRAQVRWARLSPVLNRWIPQPRTLHPYPDARFYATHPS
jgi:hypothetical protein